MEINFPSKEKSMVALQSKKEADSKANKFVHIEFIEMRTNLFANHCYIST